MQIQFPVDDKTGRDNLIRWRSRVCVCVCYLVNVYRKYNKGTCTTLASVCVCVCAVIVGPCSNAEENGRERTVEFSTGGEFSAVKTHVSRINTSGPPPQPYTRHVCIKYYYYYVRISLAHAYLPLRIIASSVRVYNTRNYILYALYYCQEIESIVQRQRNYFHADTYAAAAAVGSGLYTIMTRWRWWW